MTLTVRLDDQDERKLQEIVAAMNAENQSSAIRALIEEKWLELQGQQTFLERRGGLPEHLFDGPSDLSSRSVRKAKVADYLKQKAQRRRRSVNAEDSD